jgi:hypothetical protein
LLPLDVSTMTDTESTSADTPWGTLTDLLLDYAPMFRLEIVKRLFHLAELKPKGSGDGVTSLAFQLTCTKNASKLFEQMTWLYSHCCGVPEHQVEKFYTEHPESITVQAIAKLVSRRTQEDSLVASLTLVPTQEPSFSRSNT